MIRNQAGQVATANVKDATTGLGFGGTVTVYVEIDNGGQTIGATSSGIATAKGNGQFTYLPTQAETNGALLIFTFTGTGAVPEGVQYPTISVAQASALTQSSAPNAITVTQLITLAMKRVNILQAGESLSAEDLADGLMYANLWIDSLSIESMTLPFVLRTTFPMVSGQAIYTVGIGGDVNVARPTVAPKVNYLDASLSPAIERELTPLTDAAYQAIPIKTLTNPLPSFSYWNPTYNGGLGSLFFWLVPTSSVLTGVLYAPSAVPQFVNGTDTVVFPPGWQFFVLENLAVYYGATWRENLPVDPELKESARLSKASIKRANWRPTDMTLDPALTMGSPRSNIYVGN